MRRREKARSCPETKNRFYGTLKKRADAFFPEREISRHGDGTVVLKTMDFLFAYTLPFIALLKLRNNVLHRTYAKATGLGEDIKDREAVKLPPRIEATGSYDRSDQTNLKFCII